MITFDVITIFPELIEPFAKESLLKRAQEKKLLLFSTHDLRNWAHNRHKKVDDKPFGGGLGMVMGVEPIFNAVQAIKAGYKRGKSKVISFSPRGKKFTQAKAAELAKLDHLIFICGRYEGIDERVKRHITDEELSIGDYVLMGGEVPAMAVIETVSRLIPGVVGKPEFLRERKVKKAFLEYPQYTRPEIFVPKKGVSWRTPKVLLSGNHAKIEEWRKKRGKAIEK